MPGFRATEVRREAPALFFFFYAAMRKGGAPRPSPAPKQEGIHPTARRSPFGGGAGRRLPCPNGALLEKNGQVTRREEAAGASIWGLGSENRPSGQWAGNNRCQASTIFRPVSGPNSYGKPSVGRPQGRGGRWPPLRPPLARDPSRGRSPASLATRNERALPKKRNPRRAAAAHQEA